MEVYVRVLCGDIPDVQELPSLTIVNDDVLDIDKIIVVHRVAAHLGHEPCQVFIRLALCRSQCRILTYTFKADTPVVSPRILIDTEKLVFVTQTARKA